MSELSKCEECGRKAVDFQRYCGARVCLECGHHQHLARCYCGWSVSGGNGYQELQECGEQIEEDY